MKTLGFWMTRWDLFWCNRKSKRWQNGKGGLPMEEEKELSKCNNCRIVRDVVEELIGIVEAAKSMGEFRGTQKKESQMLQRRLRQCLPLLEELRDLDAQIPEDCISCLHRLKRAFVLAKKLLKTCHAGSKIYLVSFLFLFSYMSCTF